MGYIFIAISAVVSAFKGFMARKVSVGTGSLKDVVLINLFRTCFSCAGALLIGILAGGWSELFFENGKTYLAVLLHGFNLGLGYVTYFLAVKEACFVMTNLFTYLSIFIPIGLSALFLQEGIGVLQIFGLLVLIVSFVFAAAFNKKSTGKVTFKAVFYSLLTGISYGLQSFAMKIGNVFEKDLNSGIYSFYCFFISIVILLLWYLLLKVKQGGEREEDVTIPKICKLCLFPVMFMATASLCNNYLNTLAAGLVPSVVVFPLLKGLDMFIVFLLGSFVLKEKPNKFCYISMILCFAGLMMINFGK